MSAIFGYGYIFLSYFEYYVSVILSRYINLHKTNTKHLLKYRKHGFFQCSLKYTQILKEFAKRSTTSVHKVPRALIRKLFSLKK